MHKHAQDFMFHEISSSYFLLKPFEFSECWNQSWKSIKEIGRIFTILKILMWIVLFTCNNRAKVIEWVSNCVRSLSGLYFMWLQHFLTTVTYGISVKPHKFNIVNVSRYLKVFHDFWLVFYSFVEEKTALSPQNFVAGCLKSFVIRKSRWWWIRVEIPDERFPIIRMFCCGGNRAQFVTSFFLSLTFFSCR